MEKFKTLLNNHLNTSEPKSPKDIFNAPFNEKRKMQISLLEEYEKTKDFNVKDLYYRFSKDWTKELDEIKNELGIVTKKTNDLDINIEEEFMKIARERRGDVAESDRNKKILNAFNSLKQTTAENAQEKSNVKGGKFRDSKKAGERPVSVLPKKPVQQDIDTQDTESLSEEEPAQSDFMSANDYAKKKESNKKELQQEKRKPQQEQRKRKKRKEFIPPLKKENNDNDSKNSLLKEVSKRVFKSESKENKENKEVDERLKNLDPRLIEMIENEIMDCGSKVEWDDIAGLEHAKKSIQEAVIWPMKRPDIFTGLRRAPKGILLFGPPGTGKTLIGKCIAHTAGCTFFSISASSLTSKWVGEGEKMVRALFAVARVHQPSVIFIDEIDSLLTQRTDGEFESSRRIKTEFLIQFDGAHVNDENNVLVIGATNRPHEIDEAARRRLIKRYYIPLPDFSGRKGIINILLKKQHHVLSEEEIDRVCDKTNGYSGSDMDGLCREAALGPVREVPPEMIIDIPLDQVRAVEYKDFEEALTQVRASVSSKDLQMYEEWNKDFGSGKV